MQASLIANEGGRLRDDTLDGTPLPGDQGEPLQSSSGQFRPPPFPQPLDQDVGGTRTRRSSPSAAKIVAIILFCGFIAFLGGIIGHYMFVTKTSPPTPASPAKKRALELVAAMSAEQKCSLLNGVGWDGYNQQDGYYVGNTVKVETSAGVVPSINMQDGPQVPRQLEHE